MKTLLVLLVFSGISYAASNDTTAFVTGFAQGFNAQIGGQPYQPPTPAIVPNVYQYQLGSIHYDAVRADGNLGGMTFLSRSACMQYIRYNRWAFEDCIRVTD